MTSTPQIPAVDQDDLPPAFLPEAGMVITEGAEYQEEEKEEGEVRPPPPSQYKCNKCEATFRTKAQWTNHFNSEHGKTLSCSLCPFKGTKREDLKSHVKSFHL